MELKIRINKNSILPMCIAAYYAIQVLNRARTNLFPRASALQLALRVLTYLVIIVILLRLIQTFRNIRILIILELVALALFLISRFMGNLGEQDWVTIYTQIAVYFIPLALAAYNTVDREKLLRFLYIIALIATPFLVVTTVFSYSRWDSSYNMPLGYLMAFTALILLADFIVHARAVDIVLAVILYAFVLFVGSRGPFICILSFIVISLLLSKQISLTRKIIILALLAIVAVLVVVNLNGFLTLVYQISQRLGFDSRSIRLLMEGEAISYDTGRVEIWTYYLNLINQKPVLGYGVMGGWFHNGSYPHDIFLEFLLSFGYPGGIILSIAVVFIMFRGVRSENRYNSILAVLFVSYCTYMIISSSFLQIWQFFVCIALCIPHDTRITLFNRNQLNN